MKKAGWKRKGRQYLESGESLYTTIVDREEEEENLMEKMFVACMEWAEEHGRKFKGMVYLQAKYIYLAGDQMNSYLECWVPLEKE